MCLLAPLLVVCLLAPVVDVLACACLLRWLMCLSAPVLVMCLLGLRDACERLGLLADLKVLTWCLQVSKNDYN